MRGRMGLAGILLIAAGLGAVLCGGGGCASRGMTPQEKTQARLEKQRAAETRAAQKQAEIDRRAARRQALAEKKEAERLAREEQRQRALADAGARERLAQATPQPRDRIPFEPQAFPDVYPDDRQNVVGYPHMDPENNPRLFDAHARAMAAAGARQDGMLSDAHFEGNALSALGRSKVSLMLHNAPRSAVSIWVMRGGGDEQTNARIAAVQSFWKQSQYAAVPLQIREGMNPDATVPATDGITALQRLNRPEGVTGQASGDTTGGRGRLSGSGSSPAASPSPASSR